MNQFPPIPRVPLGPFRIFSKIRRDICSQDARGKIAAGINDTGGKFATGINDTGSIFSSSFASVIDITTPAANTWEYLRELSNKFEKVRNSGAG
jgi:hypothetical protein